MIGLLILENEVPYINWFRGRHTASMCVLLCRKQFLNWIFARCIGIDVDTTSMNGRYNERS